MITKHVFGSPFETEAINQSLEITSVLPDFFTIDTSNGFQLKATLAPEDIVYGLGEANRGINKRGFFYINYCTDDPCHTEEKNSLYGAHNFIVVDGKSPYGLFFDYPGKITFDIGFGNASDLIVYTKEADLNLYVITGESSYDIVKQFRQLIGPSYLAPFWAFGFQQSRWGYQNQEDILEITNGYQENDLPLDAIYMDIDYMENYKDFTIDETKFPNFPQFVQQMKARGIHLVPIIDAGIKIEDGYSVYEDGLKKGYYCTNEDGTPFIAGVWPGDTHFPDVLNHEAREWFGAQYKGLLSTGIEGFWNDMNEPAIFYSKQGLDTAFQTVHELKDQELSLSNFWKLKDAFAQVANNEEDHRRFYHKVNGSLIRHDKVHNLFGFNMTRAAADAFETLKPNHRVLLFSRSSYIGMHRYGGIWTGDNHSWWSHLLLNIKMMPSLNMCGFLYSGADLGGFGGHASEDLVLRWIAFSLFTPLMRNHGALGTREQECFRFPNKEAFRNLLRLRYRLIPYIYSEYMKAALTSDLLFRPLGFDYPNDTIAKHTEDQVMFGEGLMLTPVYEQNAIGRHVYLPEDMLLIHFTTADNYTTKVMNKGHHFIEVALNEVPIFLKKDHVLILGDAVNNTRDISYDNLHVIANGEDVGNYQLYQDDGYTVDCDLNKQLYAI